MFLDAKHRRAILARHKNTLLLAAMILLVVFSWAIIWLWAQYSNTATELTKLATENEQMRFADERMTRSKTDFQRPGVTAEEVQWIKAISDDYGIPADILYAMRRTENGGRGLYVGANHIDQEIRQRYPPLWWQFAQAAKTWNFRLNSMAMDDPYLRHRTLWSFAKRWTPKPDDWTKTVSDYLDSCRGPNSLAVTEPPRNAAPLSGRKAKGGGHKPSKHSSKEHTR